MDYRQFWYNFEKQQKKILESSEENQITDVPQQEVSNPVNEKPVEQSETDVDWSREFDYDESEPESAPEKYDALLGEDAYDYLDNADESEFISDTLLDEQDEDEDLSDIDEDSDEYDKEDESDMYSEDSLFDTDDEDSEEELCEDEICNEEPSAEEPCSEESFNEDVAENEISEETSCVEQCAEQQAEDEPCEDEICNEEPSAEEPCSEESFNEDVAENEISEETPCVEQCVEQQVAEEPVSSASFVSLDEPEVQEQEEVSSEETPSDSVEGFGNTLMDEIFKFIPVDCTFGTYIKSLAEDDIKDLESYIEKSKDAWLENLKEKMFNLPNSDITVGILNNTDDPMTAVQRLETVGAQMCSYEKEKWTFLKLFFKEDGTLERAATENITPDSFNEWQWKIATDVGFKLWRARN